MEAYIFRLSLSNTQSPVWRELAVPSLIDFGILADIFQLAIGYHKGLPWEFLFDEVKARITNDKALLDEVQYLKSEAGQAHLASINQEKYPVDLSVAVADAATVPMAPLFKKYKSCRFLYDPTDEWMWQVKLLDVTEDFSGHLPQLLNGQGTAPFEEMGGILGFEALLEALVENTEDAEDLRHWMAGERAMFFDKDRISKDLESFRETHLRLCDQ